MQTDKTINRMNIYPISSTRRQEKLLQCSKEELIGMIEDREKELATQRDLLKQVFTEREIILRRIRELEKQENDRLSADGYQSASSWISKIVFTLQRENRPLRSPELIRLLEKREPLLAGHHNKIQYFSAFLSTAVSYGRVIQQKVKGVRGYYYLLPSWVDEQGIVLATYRDRML
jgi:hypothetical protein